jgi:hypothetical protein
MKNQAIKALPAVPAFHPAFGNGNTPHYGL